MKKQNRTYFRIGAMTLILSLLFTLPALLARAGEPQTMKGSKSIYFRFNGLADMKVNNYKFGAQYLFADRKGACMELQVGGTKTDYGDNVEPSKSAGFGLDLQYIYYPYQKGSVAAYVAPGFGFAFGNNEYDNLSKDLVKTKTSDFSVYCSLGAEWWAFDHLSLAISSSFGFDSAKTEVKDSATGHKTTTTTTAWGNLSSGYSSVIVCFYF